MTGPRPVTNRLGPFASGHSGSGSPPRTLALARCAPLVAKLMAWHGRRRARDGASGLRSPTHSLLRARLAGDALHKTQREIPHQRDTPNMGAEAPADPARERG